MVVFGQVVVFGQRCCIRAKTVCIRSKMVLFGQSDRDRAKTVVFGAKWFYSGKSGCIPEEWMY